MIKTAGISLLIVLLFSTLSYAQRGAGRGYGYGHGNMNNDSAGAGICKGIPDLTEEQEAKFEKYRVTHMKAMNNYRNELDQKRAELRTLESADKPDMAAINKKIEEIADTKENMMKERAKHLQNLRAELTEEQRVYFDAHKGQRGKGHRHGHGFRHHDGNGPHGQGRGAGRGYGQGNCRY